MPTGHEDAGPTTDIAATTPTPGTSTGQDTPTIRSAGVSYSTDECPSDLIRLRCEPSSGRGTARSG